MYVLKQLKMVSIGLIVSARADKTWSERCRIPFLMKANWHEIKDHGLVNVEMVL